MLKKETAMIFLRISARVPLIVRTRIRKLYRSIVILKTTFPFQMHILKENALISIKISLKFVPRSTTNDIPALVLIMAWRRIGDKPLFEPILDCVSDAYVGHSASVGKYIRQISHNAPLCNTYIHLCAQFGYRAVHSGIWDWCIVGFLRQVCLLRYHMIILHSGYCDLNMVTRKHMIRFLFIFVIIIVVFVFP